MANLTREQLRCLTELGAANAALLREFPSSEGWTRAWIVPGMSEARSNKNLRSLVDLGLAGGIEPDGHRQSMWRWRITEAGRAALSEV